MVVFCYSYSYGRDHGLILKKSRLVDQKPQSFLCLNQSAFVVCNPTTNWTQKQMNIYSINAICRRQGCPWGTRENISKCWKCDINWLITFSSWSHWVHYSVSLTVIHVCVHVFLPLPRSLWHSEEFIMAQFYQVIVYLILSGVSLSLQSGFNSSAHC